jgi:hypothetical protein
MIRVTLLEGDEVIFSETNQAIASRGKVQSTGQESSACSTHLSARFSHFPPRVVVHIHSDFFRQVQWLNGHIYCHLFLATLRL